jgi:hypothetical protein
VIVGGSAVEYDTGGEVLSGDFDLVAPDAETVAEALIEVGFRREDRLDMASSRTRVHEEGGDFEPIAHLVPAG